MSQLKVKILTGEILIEEEIDKTIVEISTTEKNAKSNAAGGKQPNWNQDLSLEIQESDLQINIDLINHANSESLGSCTLDLAKFKSQQHLKESVPILNNSGDKVAEIHLEIQIFQQQKQQQKQQNQQQQAVSSTHKQEISNIQAQLTKNEKEIAKFRTYNQKLRDELKNLSDKLTKVLDKSKPKKTDVLKENPESTYKQIEISDSQIEFLEKQLKKLKEQESAVSLEKIANLENLVKDRNKEKGDIQQSIIKLEKIIKQQGKNLQELDTEGSYHQKISQLTEEAKSYREKSRDMQKKLNIQEKNQKQQEEYLTKLRQKYEEVCQQAGMEVSYNFIKEKQLTEQLDQKKKKPLVKDVMGYDKDLDEKEDEITDRSQITEEKLLKMKQKIKTLKKMKKTLENKCKNEQELQQQKIKSVEFETWQIHSFLKDKDKEIRIAEQRYAEMKKMTKFNVLTPLEFMSSVKKELVNESQKQLMKACLVARNKVTKRDAKGGIFTNQVIHFDDATILNDSINHRISQIDIYHDANQKIIYGLQTTYIVNNQEVKGNLNMANSSISKAQISKLILEENDVIKSVAGFATDSIDYLKIETQKGQILEVGSQNIREKPLEFNLDIGYSNIPIIIFGGLDYKKTGENDELALVFIGVELKNPFLPTSKKRNNSAQMDEQLQQQIQENSKKFLTKKKGMSKFSHLYENLNKSVGEEEISMIPIVKNNDDLQTKKNQQQQPQQKQKQDKGKQQGQQQQQQQEEKKDDKKAEKKDNAAAAGKKDDKKQQPEKKEQEKKIIVENKDVKEEKDKKPEVKKEEKKKK